MRIEPGSSVSGAYATTIAPRQDIGKFFTGRNVGNFDDLPATFSTLLLRNKRRGKKLVENEYLILINEFRELTNH
jgi:hypothetical protein